MYKYVVLKNMNLTELDRRESGLYVPKRTSAHGDKTTIGPWIAIVPALILGVGYVVAFVHEAGLGYAYKLPLEIIKLDWTAVMIATGTVLLLTLMITPGAFMLFAKNKGWAYKAVAFLYAVIWPALAYVVLKGYFPFGPSWAPPSAFAVSLVPIALLIPKAKYPKLPRLNTRLWVFLCAVFLVWLCGTAFVLGTTDATGKRTYYSPSSHPDAVVLRQYGDDLICASVSKGEISHSYFVLKSNEPGLVLVAKEFPYPLSVGK